MAEPTVFTPPFNTAPPDVWAEPVQNMPDPGPRFGQVVLQCPRRPEDDKAPVKIRVSLFYDGTGNNRTNVGLGREHEHGGDASYQAGLTNVAKLEYAGLQQPGPGVDHHFTVYTEGIGTDNEKADSNVGYGLGTGDTGVDAKVEKGIAEALLRIGDFAKARPIELLQIDVFGFSRGAAAARYCLWKCMQQSGRTLKDRLQAIGHIVGRVKVLFGGLFDTVASYDVDHDNDTEELHLTAIALATKVVQLAAAEEHRVNFRLTNINSAGGKGRQIFLPGAHADVGGGYADSEDEVNWQLLDLDALKLGDAGKQAMERERRWLVAAGWYRADELQPTNFWNELRATRRGISNMYSRIPLHLMAKFARENGVFFRAKLEVGESIPDTLKAASEAINAYVASGRPSLPNDWFAVNPSQAAAWHRALRHDHLHFSARYGTSLAAHEPQWVPNDPRTGQRFRIIQNG